MKSLDLWLVGFGLRCAGLLVCELACFGFVIPTLFNLHSDLANLGAALLALVGLVAGFLSVTALTREFTILLLDPDNEKNRDND
ncbi:hypothetical protein [Sphingomonas sp. PAMC 26621]|uniref:hypothetical protein n=1 Tax=Sphingomonas sp. PAMC 26621 TaxID=1112213 RepID=UPI000287E913|nr:hypothetical protein [Sphingomonas sp. PAMC 26621]